jgi:adenine-specific DNA methylase
MIAYGDSSDIFFCWIRRALVRTWPELAVSSDPSGAQEKELEIIVKRSRGLAGSDYVEHRTREHYDELIVRAFAEMGRCIEIDGVVTIVFGHGDPEVWQRLLKSLTSAGLVMTGSWPANTESGGRQGKANIQTTLTMVCRNAPQNRPEGRKGAVEEQIKAEIKKRYPDWERWGLAPADMLMAAAGPAMEVVGRYSEVLDSRGEAVEIHTFLPLARSAVQEAMAVEVDHRPLDAFDSRTRFALWWARLYGRQPQPKSELRWQTLAASLDLETVRDLVVGEKSVVALVRSVDHDTTITRDSALIDVVLALAAASTEGSGAMGEVLAASSYGSEDQFLWAAVKFLADRLPDADADSVALHRVLRARGGITTAAANVVEAERAEQSRLDVEDSQMKLI